MSELSVQTLPDQYLEKLCAWLIEQAAAYIPAVLSGGLIQVGKYQASPELHTFIATLHEGDPKDSSRSGDKDWCHEVDGKWPMEMPTCEEYWNYRYTLHLQYFMTQTGETQDVALEQGRALTQWFRQKVNAAKVGVLDLVESDFDETPLRQYVKKVEVSEGGGPTGSYIEKAVLFIEMKVILPGG